jgi:hypothetical protein
MKVAILTKGSELLISEIKKQTLLEEDEEIIFNALLCYEKNIKRATRELEEMSFWKFWNNVYERCAELKKLEKKEDRNGKEKVNV